MAIKYTPNIGVPRVDKAELFGENSPISLARPNIMSLLVIDYTMNRFILSFHCTVIGDMLLGEIIQFENIFLPPGLPNSVEHF